MKNSKHLSVHVRWSKAVFDCGFGFQLLDSNLCQGNLDSVFQSSVGFRIPWAVFRIPKSKIKSKRQTRLQKNNYALGGFGPSSRVALRSFLDKLGKRKRLCRHLLNRLISQSSSFLDESDKSLYWINQLYLCTHAYSGVLLTLSAPTLHNKTNSCRFNFMQEFWENYRLNVQF